MALDSCFYILSEIWVESSGGTMLLGEPQGFGKQPDIRFNGTKYGHRQFATLDHDFHTSAHVRQHVREVADRFLFRNVDHVISQGGIVSSLLAHRSIGARNEPWFNLLPPFCCTKQLRMLTCHYYTRCTRQRKNPST